MGSNRNKPILKIIIAGLGGGFALNLVMLLTFRLIGFGIDEKGILLNPEIQSEKLIAVWTQMKPLPLVVTNPFPMAVGLLIFGIIHAFIYYSIAPAWKQGIVNRALRFSAIVFLMSFLFWEFFTPFNQFGEPLELIGLELFFWLCIALAEGFVISIILERTRTAQDTISGIEHEG